MKITVLAENTSAYGYPAEHGLSLFVETESARFLFDMGQTDLFARNADALGIDLNTADFAVLSHGHYDHGGGIGKFLSVNDHAPVYLSSHAFEPHYNGTEKYIGLDVKLRDSGRIMPVEEELQILPGLTLYNDPNAPKVMEAGACGLKMIRDGQMRDEDFRHEQYLLAEEDGKRILFSGCSHRGILNIMHWFRPDVLIGGFHLSGYPLDQRLASIAGKLNAYKTVYYTGHCTGTAQFEFMKRYMDHLRYISTGERFTL